MRINTETQRTPGTTSAVTCFTSGTAITTLRGKLPVETLRAEDKVLTRDRGFQPILWVGSRKLCPEEIPTDTNHCPILIKAGALGPGLPEKDMRISPRHRVLTTDKAILSNLEEPEALIEARALVGQPGITKVTGAGIQYFHLLFEQHEIILSENTWTESFHLGRSVVDSLQKAQRTEILSVVPGAYSDGQIPVQRLARHCIADNMGQTKLVA